MASKSVPLFCSILLAMTLGVFPGHAYENSEPEDSMGVKSVLGEDLSEKTDGELLGMERELHRELSKDPGNADLYYRISNVYATLFDRTRTKKGGQYQEWLMKSRDALEKTLMIRPQDKVAHYNLGVVYKRQGQMERAREELRKTISLCDPEEDAYLICTSWLQIGSVYEEQGFFDDAKEAYLKAREFDFGNPDIQEAIRAVDVKRKTPQSGSGFSPMGMSSMGSRFTDPQTAAAMGQDPMSQNQGGLAQALPALGQMFAQKFSGGGEDSGGQNE